MNRFRLITSSILFLFSIYCLIFDSTLPFNLPITVYIIVTLYFAIFPIKDMISTCNRTSYKGRQFAKLYRENKEIDQEQFDRERHQNNKRALISLIFWILFMSVPAALYFTKVIGKIWIFFFFALSNFAVFFAVFFWCPFHKIFIKQECCNECRIYNWDSFFQYSFLIFIPNVYTIILFTLGVMSMAQWEWNHFKHPKRFYKSSNCSLNCEHCDMESCKKHKKKFFNKKLKELHYNDK